MSDHYMQIRMRAVGPWPVNSYVLVCQSTQRSVLIDPGADPEALGEMLNNTIPVSYTHLKCDPIAGRHARITKCNIRQHDFTCRLAPELA